MTIAERMIPELKSEAVMTRRLLGRVPPDKLSWSPGQGLHTIGWNAAHLAEIVGWVPGIVQEDGLDLASFVPTPEADDVGKLLEQFDAHLAAAAAALAGASDATMGEPWSMRMGAQVLFTMTKGDCLRKWVVTHTAHHRGILSASLRLAGVKFDSIYEEA